MGRSLDRAWSLLKDYDFIGHLPQEYYNTLPDRMAQLMESGDTLEHVNVRPTEHYNERIRQRYNADQALPPEFQKRGMKKYKFTLEAILNFMANDLALNHPELLESMGEPKRAGDPKLPDMPPSMVFDAMYTDDPKVDESENRRGLSHRVSPHFLLDENGKLRLATVGHGKLSDIRRQNIHAVPTTSLLTDTHDNSAIDERLPNRFDFLDRGTPDMPEIPVEEESPLPQTFSPQEKDYSNLPPAYREAARLADEQKNASEPMDLAMRLLKDEETHPNWGQPTVGINLRTKVKRPTTQLRTANYDGAGNSVIADGDETATLRRRNDGWEMSSSKETDVPFNEETGFTRGEPMDITMRLLKEMAI